MFSGPQRGGDPDSPDHVGGGEDDPARPQQRHRHQEGDIRRDHRVAAGLQWVFSL